MLPRLIIAFLAFAATATAATFGDPTAYSTNFTIKDVVAAIAGTPSQSGRCDSITAYLKFNLDSCKARAALYTIAGADTVLVAGGVSIERRFAANAAFAWQGFAFADPKPAINANITYLIAIFADTAGATGAGLARVGVSSGGATLVSKNANYESGVPATLNPSSGAASFRMSIYVTYTPTLGPPPRRRLIAPPR